jgi:hypothetical protein
MVTEIHGYLDQLQKEYDNNVKTINSLTAAGKTDEANIYKKANEDIMATMTQLNTWLTGIISGKPINIPVTVTVDTTAAQKALDDFVNVGSGAWQRSNKGAGAAGISIPATVTIDNADALAKVADVGKSLDILTGRFNSTVLSIMVNNSGALGAIYQVQNALAAIQDKTVTVYVDYISSGSPPSYQTGGILPYTGLFFGHEGEEVIPANQVASSSPSASVPNVRPSTINFENQTIVQVDGETVQRSMERRMIRNRQVGSRY